MFLRTFHATYGELLKIFTVREVAGFVRETLGCLPAAAHADCPLEAVKLQCIAKTVESQLYVNPGASTLARSATKHPLRANYNVRLLPPCGAESRCILLPVVLRVLHVHMQEQRDLVMCARILTSMLSLVKKEENGTAVSPVSLAKDASARHSVGTRGDLRTPFPAVPGA